MSWDFLLALRTTTYHHQCLFYKYTSCQAAKDLQLHFYLHAVVLIQFHVIFRIKKIRRSLFNSNTVSVFSSLSTLLCLSLWTLKHTQTHIIIRKMLSNLLEFFCKSSTLAPSKNTSIKEGDFHGHVKY